MQYILLAKQIGLLGPARQKGEAEPLICPLQATHRLTDPYKVNKAANRPAGPSYAGQQTFAAFEVRPSVLPCLTATLRTATSV